MSEPSSFHYSHPLQVNLENISQVKHDAYGVPYLIPAPQSSDSQGHPSVNTQITDESRDALLPRYAYGQQQFTQPVQNIAQPRSRYISQIERDRPVHDYFWLSVFATLCFCLPIGICAIAESLRARKLVSEGRHADAQKSSRCALYLNIASLILGVISIAVFTIYRIVIAKDDLKQEYNDP